MGSFGEILEDRDSVEGGCTEFKESGSQTTYRWGWQFWREGVPWVAQRV